VNQTLLPIWSNPDDVEHSTLAEMRQEEYEKHGPAIVREVALVLDQYQGDHNGAPGYLARLNTLSMELSTLCQKWFDFSCACFELFLDPPKYNHDTKIRMLRGMMSDLGNARYT
jgi:hypothetical protein